MIRQNRSDSGLPHWEVGASRRAAPFRRDEARGVMSPVYPGVTQLVGGKMHADSGLQENIQESPLPVTGRVDSMSLWEKEKAKGTAFCWIHNPGPALAARTLQELGTC